MARKYHQGKYAPINPIKYRGDHTNIVYRSSWEKRFFLWADSNPSVLEWSSEEVIIPYLCETDNRIHRYYLDAHVKIKDATGNVGIFLVEIKPYSQTLPPKFPGRQTRRYLDEVETFVKNQSKWKAAKKFADESGVQFVILTENELGIKNGSKK